MRLAASSGRKLNFADRCNEPISSLKMVTKVFLFIALFGAASSSLPKIRKCDPEQEQVGPTLCSNYKNIEYLYKEKKKLVGDMNALRALVMELGKMKSDTEKNFTDMRTQLGNHQDDIESLKREVKALARHGGSVGGNLSEIEARLDTTERHLREKKAKLENLETETETAFNNTRTLMILYQREFSHLNTTARKLETKTTALDTKLNKIQTTSETLGAKLNKQKSEVDKLKGETRSKFRNVDEQIKSQNAALNKQQNDTGALKSDSAGIAIQLKSAVTAQDTLRREVGSLKAQANAKVAFSATIIQSKDVFTGPKTASTSGILIFNRVFTNVGNAYNHKTGIFTAPLKGVYHFSFMTFGYNSHSSGAILVKNGRYQVSTWEFTGPDASDTTSNTVVLELNVGECVNIILWEGGKIHTSVFSGFLIFPTS